jgi:NAD(P)H-flavin reductase
MQTIKCKLLKNTTLDENYLLDFEWDRRSHGACTHARAGQFFMIKMLRTSVFLPRPISVAGATESSLSFLINVRGQGSRELALMNAGEEAILTGPLGNCFADFLSATNARIALVAGGTGFAPLMFFANELEALHGKYKVDFYAGFKRDSPALRELVNRQIDKLTVACEEVADASAGASEGVQKGFITDYLRAQDYQAVFCCGPAAMISKIAEMCRGAIPCFASFENRMACGVGACLGCTIRGGGAGGNRRVCADGPIFNVEEIFYE